MLKAESRCGDTKVDFAGDVVVAVADTLTIIRSLWESFEDEKDREFFEHGIKTSMEDTFAPIEELHARAMRNIPGIVKMLANKSADERKEFMDNMPEDMLAEVMAEVMKNAD